MLVACVPCVLIGARAADAAIVFMDEPTSGLDARAAAVVMRTVSQPYLVFLLPFSPAAHLFSFYLSMRCFMQIVAAVFPCCLCPHSCLLFRPQLGGSCRWVQVMASIV